MALKAGTKKRGSANENQYDDSMAAAMEAAFKEEWPVIMGTSAPQLDDQMRLLFIAVAQGVIRYLKNNQDSITVSVPSGGGTVSAKIAITDPLY